MQRSIILLGAAITLLFAGAVAVILATTRSAPAASLREAPPDAAPSPPSVSTEPHLAAVAPSSPPSSTPVAPRASAASGRTWPRSPRSARAAVLAAKLQQLPKASQDPAPVAKPARERLPPEEVAAMEARGLNWRNLERAMRGEVPSEGGTTRTVNPPEPGEGYDEDR